MQAPSRALVLVTLLVVLCIAYTAAYPSGAPKCSSHTPKHNSSKAKTGKAPYKITAAAAGKTVTVTLSGVNDAKFKGFFIYATAADSPDTKIGKFTKATKTSVLSCGGSSSAITHSDNSDKSSIAVTWTAPDSFSGNVEFKATVVKEFKEFWTGVKSAQVSIA